MVRQPSPEKRAKFLSAALKLFAANGVRHTSTAAIAREAGAASGTLFLYFPTKQDLINQVALEIGRQQSAYIQSVLDLSQPARQLFYQIWEGSIRWFMDHMDAYHYNQQIRNTGLVDQATIQESEKMLAYYFHAIEKGLAEGAIKPYSTEIIGTILYLDIVAILNLIAALDSDAGQQTADKQEEYIHTGFEIFWNGIKET